MPDSQGFNYEQPGRDTLTGIYVEVSDSGARTHGELTEREAKPLLQMQRLFRLTLSVVDARTNGSTRATRE
jgi:hypothetical protein